MARGQKAEVGDTRTAPNGYHYTKTPERWELSHRLVIEEQLERKLLPGERVRFADGDKTNFDPGNLVLTQTKKPTVKSRIARLESKKEEIDAELQFLYNKDREAS